jgi:hypothetical protein
MLAVIVGIAFGVLQLFILYNMIKALTAGKSANMLALLMLKLVLWGGFLAVTALLFKDNILAVGTGAAATLVAGSFAGFWIMQRNQEKDKNKDKEETAA